MKIASAKKRIIHYLDFKEIKLSDFYVKTGLKRGLLDSDKLHQGITDEKIATIIEIFPDLNVIWLITGKGEMIRTDEPQNSTHAVSDNAGIIAFLKSELKERNSEIAELNKQIGCLEERVETLSKKSIDDYDDMDVEDAACAAVG